MTKSLLVGVNCLTGGSTSIFDFVGCDDDKDECKPVSNLSSVVGVNGFSRYDGTGKR